MTISVRPKVLLMGPLTYVKDTFVEKITPLADIVECTSQTYDELAEDFNTRYAGVQVIYHYRNPGGAFGYFGEDFLRRVPPSCKVITHLGAGYDDIDVVAAKKHNITVNHQRALRI